MMIVGFSACSDDDDDVVTPSEESIAGIWQETRCEGTDDGSYFVEDESTYNGWRYITIFESDGTYKKGVIEPGKDFRIDWTGTWTLSDDDTPVISVSKKYYGYMSRNVNYEIIELTREKLVVHSVEYDGYEKYDTKTTFKRISSID